MVRLIKVIIKAPLKPLKYHSSMAPRGLRKYASVVREAHASWDNRDTNEGPLRLLGTIVYWCSRSFRGPTQMKAPLRLLGTTVYWCSRSFRGPQ